MDRVMKKTKIYLVVALLLAVVHLPESWPQWLGWTRPAWVVMVPTSFPPTLIWLPFRVRPPASARSNRSSALAPPAWPS